MVSAVEEAVRLGITLRGMNGDDWVEDAVKSRTALRCPFSVLVVHCERS